MKHMARRITAPALTLGLLALSAGPAAADITPPTPTRPPGTEGLTTLMNWGMWIVTFAGIIGVLIANFIVDIAYVIVDPRTRAGIQGS